MPQASSIVINDGTENLTFTPVSTGQVSLFEARDSATSAGFQQLILGLDRAKPTRKTNKVEVRIARPIEATVDGSVVIRCTPRFFGNWVLPDDMTLEERTAFATQVVNALSNAVVKGYATNVEPVW